MKILRVFGVVVGVHALALMLIFVNPGCSSANKPPQPADTTGKSDENPTVIADQAPAVDPSAPWNANPTVSAVPADAGEPATVRFSPTRPGTPAANLLESQPVADVTPVTTYTVVPGDSLWTIARKNKLTVAELAAANNIRQNATVRIGQKLFIPAKAVSGSSVAVTDPAAAPTRAAPPPSPRNSRQAVKHVVRPGETLGAIARKYQVKVGEIATANNIADPARIRPGQELTIPGWQAPASRAPATAAPTETSETAAPEQPAAEVPTLIIPPEGEAPAANEPPVIKVDEQ